VPHALLVSPGWQSFKASRQPAQVPPSHCCVVVLQVAPQPVQLLHDLLMPPQVASAVPVWQVFVPSQQPAGQAHACTQAAAMQSWPVKQRWQIRPPAPQARVVLPV
jgi:hypothetical protein